MKKAQNASDGLLPSKSKEKYIVFEYFVVEKNMYVKTFYESREHWHYSLGSITTLSSARGASLKCNDQLS